MVYNRHLAQGVRAGMMPEKEPQGSPGPMLVWTPSEAGPR